MANILTPEQVDRIWKLPRGKAQRLGRRGALPALLFPDGTVRFDADELTRHLESNPSTKTSSCNPHGHYSKEEK